MWCGEGDLNPHEIAPASTSSWCVCQFRHLRVQTACYFLAGVGCAAILCGAMEPAGRGIWTGTGAVFGGAPLFAGADSSTVVPRPALRVARIESESDVTMNRIAEIVVAFESSVAEPRGPKAVCEPMPPNAPARSAAFPLCSRTTRIKIKQTITCTAVMAQIMAFRV